MSKLMGKAALVTGAGRGIGRAIAERLAADGAMVIVNYARSEAAALDLVNSIENSGGKALPVAGDLSDLKQIDSMFETLTNKVQQIDILVNNAGRGSNGMPTLDTSTAQQFDALFNLNARGLFFTTQAAARMMPQGGRIINISSTVTHARVSGLSIYAGSKAAVEAFTRIWAAELAPRKITVNAVLPGITDTDLIRDNMPPEAARAAARAVPLGRMGLPGDIANVVSFLASDDAGWISGQCIAANGGA